MATLSRTVGAYSLCSPLHTSFSPTSLPDLEVGRFTPSQARCMQNARKKVHKIALNAGFQVGPWYLTAPWVQARFSLRLHHSHGSPNWTLAIKNICHLLDVGYRAQDEPSLHWTLPCLMTTLVTLNIPLSLASLCWLGLVSRL